MYDKNQTVLMKWNNTNRMWYENRGYTFTNESATFEVRVDDLSPHSSKKIKVICDYCGKEFATQFATIASGHKIIQKDACSACAGKKASEISFVRRKMTYFNSAIEICHSNGYEMITSPESYHDIKMDITFFCPKHGEQTMMLENLLHGHKCKECSYDARADKKRLDKDYINSVLLEKGARWMNQDEYVNCTKRNMRIQCACGNEFTTSFVNFKKAGIYRCHLCSKKDSLGEVKIQKFLDEHHVNYVREKRFEDCRDKKTLPFDFFLPDYNICVEFDGQHHYKDVFGPVHLEETKYHDKLKNEYCERSGISLIRIPYWNGNNIQSILSEEIDL